MIVQTERYIIGNASIKLGICLIWKYLRKPIVKGNKYNINNNNVNIFVL
jgi:hypothetical protein